MLILSSKTVSSRHTPESRAGIGRVGSRVARQAQADWQTGGRQQATK